MAPTGSALLHEVAKRILAEYLRVDGATQIVVTQALRDEAAGVDLEYIRGARKVSVKVKADAYFGTDPAKSANRDLPYYRAETHSYGLESIADTRTRAPGWIATSRADELFYYRLVIAQAEEDIAALMEGPDQVLFSELAVERDELRIMSMRELSSWFDKTQDRYMPRPVVTDGRPAWYRIVPEKDVDAEVPGLRLVGPVFEGLRRR